MTGKEIAAGFQACQFAIDANIRGISQEESLRASGVSGNCLNWIAGHILVTRQELLSALGIGTMPDVSQATLYGTGSGPIGSSSTATELSAIRHALQSTHDELLQYLSTLSEMDLDVGVEPDLLPFPTLEPNRGGLLVLAIFHEAYHSGQLGLARRAIGKPSGLGF